MDKTIADDVWNDTFDKLLEPRPILRQLNVLKKNIRASFNNDSSVENSGATLDQSISPLIAKNQLRANCIPKHFVETISTPLVTRLTINPFNCPISPISNWKFDFLENDKPIQMKKPRPVKENEPNKKTISKSKPLKKKRVCFENEKESMDSVKIITHSIVKSPVKQCEEDAIKRDSKELALQPGKWRKSLITWRQSHHIENKAQPIKMVRNTRKSSNTNSVEFVSLVPVGGSRKSVHVNRETNSFGKTSTANISGTNWKKEVLKRCEQRRPIPFSRLYPLNSMSECKKIGEGVYGEVFLNPSTDSQELDTVLKIIPIELSEIVNGEQQKTFEQILPEIIISKELCSLRDHSDKEHFTSGFVEIKKVSLIQGKYPSYFITLWEKYDEDKISENDHPKIFTDSQLYIGLELKFAGGDLSGFTFSNAEQSYYVLLQIIMTLAIGEEAFQFEHRDLHWGNILVINTNESHINYKISNKSLTVPTKGVKVTIIDYTLSRITFDDICLYNDLSKDEELFAAVGDYQYEIYRMMREALKNNWAEFEPKTNVFWLSYIIDKLINVVHYKNACSKTHKMHIKKLKQIESKIMTFKSAKECADSVFL